MNKFVIIGLTLLLTAKVFGQINMTDSTVQVIGYWDNKEKQTYIITTEKYKVRGLDTTTREVMKYEVDVTIKDSTATSYTIEWFYKNFNTTSDNQFVKKLISISQDMSVLIKTDEMGAFVEVVNWKEVRDFIKKTTTILQNEFKEIPKIEKIINQIVSMFLTKEAIESAAIKDIQQFYTYHGGKYKLSEEATGQMKIPNLYGGAPFDAELRVKLDEINIDDANSIIRMWQSVNSKQLTDASYKFIKEMTKKMGTKPPKRDEIPPLQNETRSVSRIHGPTGWIIYSVETKEVSADNAISFEERTIELK